MCLAIHSLHQGRNSRSPSTQHLINLCQSFSRCFNGRFGGCVQHASRHCLGLTELFVILLLVDMCIIDEFRERAEDCVLPCLFTFQRECAAVSSHHQNEFAPACLKPNRRQLFAFNGRQCLMVDMKNRAVSTSSQPSTSLIKTYRLQA